MASEVIDLTVSSDESDQDSGDNGSDEGGQPVEVEAPTTTQLLVAIGHVPEARLREVISKVVQEDPNIEYALMQEFFTVKKRSREVIERWEICANCREEYDASQDQDDEECSYHPGRESWLRVNIPC